MLAGMSHHLGARNTRPVVPLAMYMASEASSNS
jgi:hypothetical protein